MRTIFLPRLDFWQVIVAKAEFSTWIYWATGDDRWRVRGAQRAPLKRSQDRGPTCKALKNRGNGAPDWIRTSGLRLRSNLG